MSIGEKTIMATVNPKVSVIVLAYNIERYLSEALQSILMQRTSFAYEIVVGEDCSGDSTKEILMSYAEREPGKFKLVFQEHNVGLVPNFLDTLSACTGELIAVCDGDDYWTDPDKLQKQVDFLDTHPEYGVVFTDADVYYEAEKRFVRAYDKVVRKTIPEGDVFSAIIFSSNPYRISTSLFRSSLLADYKQFLARWRFHVNDFPLWVSIARQAMVGYIPVSTAVYRVRSRSWSHLDTMQGVIRFCRNKYRNWLLIAERYGITADRKWLRRRYLRDVIGECAHRKNLRMLRRYTGSYVLGIIIIARQYLVELAYRLKKTKDDGLLPLFGSGEAPYQ